MQREVCLRTLHASSSPVPVIKCTPKSSSQKEELLGLTVPAGQRLHRGGGHGCRCQEQAALPKSFTTTPTEGSNVCRAYGHISHSNHLMLTLVVKDKLLISVSEMDLGYKGKSKPASDAIHVVIFATKSDHFRIFLFSTLLP